MFTTFGDGDAPEILIYDSLVLGLTDLITEKSSTIDGRISSVPGLHFLEPVKDSSSGKKNLFILLMGV